MSKLNTLGTFFLLILMLLGIPIFTSIVVALLIVHIVIMLILVLIDMVTGVIRR